MAKGGWISLAAILALAASGCGQSGQNGAQAETEEEVLPATESFREFGEYVLHFNAVSTDQLSELVADEYGIIRSRNRALLNVSIRRNEAIGTSAVAGVVTASARNLTGQLRNLAMREIREGEAIYYIAETQIANAETLIFTVEATPESETEPLTVSFQKQFFVDE